MSLPSSSCTQNRAMSISTRRMPESPTSSATVAGWRAEKLAASHARPSTKPASTSSQRTLCARMPESQADCVSFHMGFQNECIEGALYAVDYFCRPIIFCC